MMLYKYFKAKGFLRKKVFRVFSMMEKKIQYYATKKIVSGENAQRLIVEWIESGTPFMISRFGSVELRCVSESEMYDRRREKAFCEKTWKSMGNNAGLFPVTESSLMRFATIMKECCKQVDLLGVWFIPMEDYMIYKYMGGIEITRLGSLEPYRFNFPWTKALRGKKVLVVHPFSETIQEQYEKRELVWGEREILPEFELQTIQAVQSAAGEVDLPYKDWFEALEYMKEEIAKRDFDIAIIGCGAYGFPLASYIKELGKQAIHMGGATQLLFGIKGKRWENDMGVNKYFNEYWVRPSEKETPTNSKRIEDGCYW